MIGRQDHRPASLPPPAAVARDPHIRVVKVPGGHSPQADENARPDQRKLPPQVRQAGLSLVVGGIAVAGRAAFDNVGDVQLVPRHADGGKHAVEQLAGRPDKRPALKVLLAARTLANEHGDGIPAPLAKRGICASLA